MRAIDREDLLDSEFRSPVWRNAHNDEVAALLSAFGRAYERWAEAPLSQAG